MLYTLLSTIAAFTFLLTSPLFSQMKNLQTSFAVLGGEYSELYGPVRVDNASLGMEVTAKSALVADKKSGHILYHKNSNHAVSSASITKLMTALAVLDLKPDWSRSITIIPQDQREGNIVYLFNGEKVSVRTLFDLMLIASSNEAAAALVRSTGKEVQNFVHFMNKKADELYLKNTVFFEPTGLDARNISSAADITLLAREAFSHSEITDVIDTEKYQFTVLNTQTSRIAFNTNKLLNSFLNDRELGYEVVGGKTGFLNEIGYNMTMELAKNRNPVIITVLGSDGEEGRLQDVKSLAEWVYRSYEWP